MIRISIRNLSADLEFEIGRKPTVSRADIEHVLGTAPLDIPGMPAAFAEGNLQALFDKVAEVFASFTPKDVALPGDTEVAETGELPRPQVRAASVSTAEKPAALEAQYTAAVTFQGTTFNVGFAGSRVLIPVVPAFAFTGFKNAHHLWEAAAEKGEACHARMEIDPEARRQRISCVTLAGLDIAWSDAKRRMQKRQITGKREEDLDSEFVTLRNLVVDAGIRIQQELLGLPSDPQKVMYASESDLAGVLNKSQLLNLLLSGDPGWTRDRLDVLLVDQGILRADALTWGKTELGAITQTAVREGFVKIFSVRCERKEKPGQDAHDAYVQRWKPYFTQKTVDYILSGPQGDASNWGLARVRQIEDSRTLPGEVLPPPVPDLTPSASDNK